MLRLLERMGSKKSLRPSWAGVMGLVAGLLGKKDSKATVAATDRLVSSKGFFVVDGCMDFWFLNLLLFLFHPFHHQTVIGVGTVGAGVLHQVQLHRIAFKIGGINACFATAAIICKIEGVFCAPVFSKHKYLPVYFASKAAIGPKNGGQHGAIGNFGLPFAHQQFCGRFWHKCHTYYHSQGNGQFY
jgi:hypothetical protein